MMLSTRNQIDAEVTEVRRGGVHTLVLLKTAQETPLYASITGEASEALALGAGDRVIAFFKASDVIIATGWAIPVSARNRLDGAVEEITHGVVNAEVRIELLGGDRLSATVTKEAVSNLALATGIPVVAIIKASDVMIAKPLGRAGSLYASTGVGERRNP